MADKHCTCEHCGAQFIVPAVKCGPAPKYCSKRCKWRRSAKIKNAAASAKKASAVHACQQCGATWQGRKRKFCSQRCSNLSRTKTGKAREQIRQEARNRRTRECLHCGIKYVARYDGRHGYTYCSRDCAFAARSLAKKGPSCSVSFNTCTECGETFSGRRRSRLCGDTCRAAHASRKAREASEEAHKKAAEVECSCCGATFCRIYGEKSKLCSDQCRRTLYRAERRKRGNTHRKRAKYYGVPCETVDPFRVFSRDGWRCQMCGTKTPQRLRGTLNKKAPELDHIVPMSKGGAHSYMNTQCLCRACNGAKSNEVIGQLRLVG